MEGIFGFLLFALFIVVWRQSSQLTKLERRLRLQELRLKDLTRPSTSSASEASAVDVSASSANSPTISTRNPEKPAPAPKEAQPDFFSKLLEKCISQLKKNGLLWLGGVTLSLGGVFLAIYAVEVGALSPKVRLAFGGAFGLALIGGAEYLSAHRLRFEIRSPYIVAALASGGLITCYAMVLVTHSFYAYISTGAAFLLLAGISLIGTWMTLRYGALLAIVGLAGAYLVPVLLPSDSSSVGLLIVYLWCISTSSVYVAEKVSAKMLLWLALAGHSLLTVMTSAEVSGYQFYFLLLNTLAILYLYGLVPGTGWALSHRTRHAIPLKQWIKADINTAAVAVSTCLLWLALILSADSTQIVGMGSVFALALIIVPLLHSRWDGLIFVTMATVAVSYLRLNEVVVGAPTASPFSLDQGFLQLAALALTIYGAVMARQQPLRNAFAVLTVIAVPALYTLSYAVADGNGILFRHWYTAQLAVYALAGSIVALRTSDPFRAMCATVFMHSCLALIFIMQLSGSVLSMVLAVQVAIAVYQSNRFHIVIPAWLYKVAISLLLLRLSSLLIGDVRGHNPFHNPTGDGSLFVTYAVVIGAMVLSYRLCKQAHLQRWFAGAIMHVTALFLTNGTIYLLTGNTSISSINYSTAALLSCNWLLLAAVYFYRARSSENMLKLYRAFGTVLTGLALTLHIWLTVIGNPFLQHMFFEETWRQLWLLVLWGLPGLILYFISSALQSTSLGNGVRVLSALFMVLFINALIRSSFHLPGIDVMQGIRQPELYTYSIVWLVLSLALLFLSQLRRFTQLNKVGFGILLIVICKVFLIDMAHLEGLLRAISFIGLGISLIGLGWLFQRFRLVADEPKAA